MQIGLHHRRDRTLALALALGLTGAGSLLAGCAGGGGPAPLGHDATGTVVEVVAAENFWGSIASQIGGVHAQVTSIITNPNTDPHAYEPTPADGRTMAGANLVVENGVGYDPWAPRLLAADPGARTVLDVGNLLGLKEGDNPHRWYNPADVKRVVSTLVADFEKLDPADSDYFAAQGTAFDTVALAPFDALIASIRADYAGTPVGASESIFSMLAPSLGLDLITPSSFLRAISEGSDVTAGDKTTIDDQIQGHLIRIYVYNSQNATPDIQAQLAGCRAAGIPTATITETLDPATATYQAWQTAQLQGIQAALAKATGH